MCVYGVRVKDTATLTKQQRSSLASFFVVKTQQSIEAVNDVLSAQLSLVLSPYQRLEPVN